MPWLEGAFNKTIHQIRIDAQRQVFSEGSPRPGDQIHHLPDQRLHSKSVTRLDQRTHQRPFEDLTPSDWPPGLLLGLPPVSESGFLPICLLSWHFSTTVWALSSRAPASSLLPPNAFSPLFWQPPLLGWFQSSEVSEVGCRVQAAFCCLATGNKCLLVMAASCKTEPGLGPWGVGASRGFSGATGEEVAGEEVAEEERERERQTDRQAPWFCMVTE